MLLASGVAVEAACVEGAATRHRGEAGETMVQSYEEFARKMAGRKAKKQAKKQAAAKTHGAQ